MKSRDRLAVLGNYLTNTGNRGGCTGHAFNMPQVARYFAQLCTFSGRYCNSVLNCIHFVDEATMSGTVDRSLLLGRDYWLVIWTPTAGTSAADIEAHLDAHLGWLLDLEQTGELFLSGPLIAGPRVGPGSGITVLRPDNEDAARQIATADPFVTAGLRTFELLQWRLNEGALTLTLSLGTASYRWH